MRGDTIKPGLRLAALTTGALLSGCATGPLASLAPVHHMPPVAAATRPVPPAGASANQTIPPRAPDGSYRTINSGLSPAATIWHVRSALNVAALGCREQEAAIVAGYNALLASKKTLLKTAFAQTEAEARKAGGADWRDSHDRDMTKVYNFFAQPPAKAGFCAVATEIAAEAAAVPAQQFQSYADAALVRLEAPFLAFYRDYDRYRVALAAWDASAPASAGVDPARTGVALSYAPVTSVIGGPPASSQGDRRLAATDAIGPRR